MKAKNLKKKSIALALMLGVLTMGTAAFAGDSFTTYSVSVPKHNGSGYSGTQSKATSGANARVKSKSTDSYEVDVRQQKSDGTASGSWYRDLKGEMDTGYNIDGHKDQIFGATCRLQFSNNLLTSKDITCKGEWASQ